MKTTSRQKMNLMVFTNSKIAMKAKTPWGQTKSLQSYVLVRFIYLAFIERFLMQIICFFIV